MLVKNSNEVGLFLAAGASQGVEPGTFLLLTLMPKITKLATELWKFDFGFASTTITGL